jgi:hypothetical protein
MVWKQELGGKLGGRVGMLLLRPLSPLTWCCLWNVNVLSTTAIRFMLD